MELTSETLRKIIQEELENVMKEVDKPMMPMDGEGASIKQLEAMCANGNKMACEELEDIYRSGGYKHMEMPGEQYDPDY